MQYKIFLLLAFSLLIAIACSRDQGSPQTQQPATTAEPESMTVEKMDSDEQVNGQEGDDDAGATALPTANADITPSDSGLAPAEVQPACASLALTPDEPIEMDTWPHQEITAVVWSPDSTKLAVVDGEGAWLYDLIGDEVTRQKLDDDAIKATSVAFNSTSEQMAVGSTDGQIQLWDIDGGELIAQFAGHDAPVESLAFNPAGTVLASGAGQWYADFVPRAEGVETRLWDVDTSELRGVLVEDMIAPPVSHLAFSPDGTVLAVGQQGHKCASPRCADGRLRFWRPETNEIAEMTVGHDIAFSDNGQFVAALGQIYESGHVQIWEVETGSRLPSTTTVPDGFAFDLALSQDGSTAAVVMGEYGYGGQMANVWDVDTVEELAVVESGAPIALSADGCILVSSPPSESANGQIVTVADDWLRLWDVSRGAELVRLVEVEGSIGQLAFSPDGAWLAATEIDVMGSQLHLIAIPQPLTSQNAGNVAARPSPTPAQALEPTAAMAGVTPSATADAGQVAAGAEATFTPPPSPTTPPWTATPIQPEPTVPCQAVWFMHNPPDACPAGPALTSSAASQRFERGRMIWVEETDTLRGDLLRSHLLSAGRRRLGYCPGHRRHRGKCVVEMGKNRLIP